jgi:RHS repeat-associated protein
MAYDQQGTAQIAVNATTLAVAVRKLDPYGNARGTAPAWPNSLGFVGGTTEPTGLVHAGARMYDSTTGRFTSHDPVVDTNATRHYDWFGPAPRPAYLPGGNANPYNYCVTDPANCQTIHADSNKGEEGSAFWPDCHVTKRDTHWWWGLIKYHVRCTLSDAFVNDFILIFGVPVGYGTLLLAFAAIMASLIAGTVWTPIGWVVGLIAALSAILVFVAGNMILAIELLYSTCTRKKGVWITMIVAVTKGPHFPVGVRPTGVGCQ